MHSVICPMSLAIQEAFDANLNNKNSEKFKKYKSDIEKAISDSYKSVKGFISATVTGFRPGSVIVDFFITTSEVVPISEETNTAIFTTMKTLNYNIDETSVAQTDNIDMRARTAVFPEQHIKLTCNPSNLIGKINWRFQGDMIQPNSHYVFSNDYRFLTIKGVNISDNGRYECLFTTNQGPHIIWDRIDYIKPYPSMQVTFNKTYACESRTVELICCVNSDYSVHWEQEKKMLSSKIDSLKCITQPFDITPGNVCGTKTTYTCKLDNSDLYEFSYSSRAVEVTVISPKPANSPATCNNEVYGYGEFGGPSKIGDCDKNKVGFREGVCGADGNWVTVKDNCVLRIIEVLDKESQDLHTDSLITFVEKVNNATMINKEEIFNSEVTLSTIVGILNNIAEASQKLSLDEVVLTNFFSIVDIISSENAIPVWSQINQDDTSQGNSSQLLNAIESVIKATSNTDLNIMSPTKSFLFKKVTTSATDFRQELKLNSTAAIFIPEITGTKKNVTITAVAFSSLGNVMPARNRTDNLNNTENVINGLIVVVNTSVPVNNIQLTFEKLSNSTTRNNKTVNLGNLQCVFWDFNLFNSTGGWDSTGCYAIVVNGTDTCQCNHTTSFSILMSPYVPEDLALSVITYVGVSISIASLVVCLIIEMIIWKGVTRNPTSHIRHVSLVNLALSLLIADICFIIGAAIVKPGEDFTKSCSAAVFFTHFFYLALFFWMMVSALLLLYRITMVLSHVSKSIMMVVSFTLGYGAPLIISVVTVASTAGNNRYVTQNGACWLNWDPSRALLAFVIPALVIVVFNIIVVVIVIVRMLRGGVGESNRDERNILKVVLRCVAILTPLFGITWGLGLGIMIEPKALAVHYLFAIFNSLQGLFILIFGTLMEKKVRETLKVRLGISRRSGYSVTHTSRSGSNFHSSSFNRTTLTEVLNTLMRRERNHRTTMNSSQNSTGSEDFVTA